MEMNRLANCRISMIITLGRMRGMVMCSSISLRLAPSMAALSYKAGSMPEIAARYTMVE